MNETAKRLGIGLRHIWFGLYLIVSTLFRFARLVVASALYSIGFVGGLIRSLGGRIAHPSDRRRLDRWTGNR